MHKIKRYFKGVGIESKRVRWPHKKELWTAVGIVCGVTIFSALMLLCADLIAAYLIEGFENAFPSSAPESTPDGSLVNVIKSIGGLF